MTIIQEKFDALKKFAIEEKIATPLVNYDMPPIVFDYSLLADMYEGEYIKHTAPLSQLIMEQLKKDRFVTFTMQDYQADNNCFDVSEVRITPNEKQLEMIKRDNFGAVLLGYHCLQFLNKQQYEFNYSVNKAKNDHDVFESEWKRLTPIFELHKNYSEFKKEAEKYGVADLLGAWDKPVVPPHKPENTPLMRLDDEEEKPYLDFSRSYSKARDRIALEKYIDQCKLQHDELAALPFPYYVAVKANMFLITVGSDGTGTRKNTVHHIVVEEAFSKGRLKRNANEFLCGGNSHYGLSSRKDDGIENDSTRHGSVPYEVTCDRCLKIAHRLLGQATPTRQ